MVETPEAVSGSRVAGVPLSCGGPRGVADLQSLRVDRLQRATLERRDDIRALLCGNHSDHSRREIHLGICIAVSESRQITGWAIVRTQRGSQTPMVRDRL